MASNRSQHTATSKPGAYANVPHVTIFLHFRTQNKENAVYRTPSTRVRATHVSKQKQKHRTTGQQYDGSMTVRQY